MTPVRTLWVLVLMLVSISPSLAAPPTCKSPPEGESWVFRRSYYTHDPVIAVADSRQVARGPVYTRPQGEYVRGSYRNSYNVIRVNGQIWDRTWNWDSWVQYGSQR